MTEGHAAVHAPPGLLPAGSSRQGLGEFRPVVQPLGLRALRPAPSRGHSRKPVDLAQGASPPPRAARRRRRRRTHGRATRLQDALVVGGQHLHEVRDQVLPVVEHPPRQRTPGVPEVVFHQPVDQPDVRLVHQRLELHHGGVAARAEAPLAVEDEGQAAAHPGARSCARSARAPPPHRRSCTRSRGRPRPPPPPSHRCCGPRSAHRPGRRRRARRRSRRRGRCCPPPRFPRARSGWLPEGGR